MALTAANNTVQLTITSTDVNGNTSWNRGAGNPTLNGIFGEGAINQNIAVGTSTLSTGIPFFNMFIKNNAAPGSGITVKVTLTLSGGAAQDVALLQPGGMFCVWNVISSVAGSGYTTTAVTVVGGIAPIEFFFGG